MMNILINGNGTINFTGMADNIKNGFLGFFSSAMISLGIGELYADIQNDLTVMHNLYYNRDVAFSVIGTCLMNAISVRGDNSGDVMSPYTADITWVNEGKISTCSIRVNPKSVENAIKFELAYKSLVFGIFHGYFEAVAADALLHGLSVLQRE